MPSDERAGVAGKHALVTGGARGIGRAIAMLLADRGARVSVVSRSPEAMGAAFLCARADVTDENDVAHAFDACREANGPIGILVNNAGIAESAPLTRTSREMWDRILATNLTGTFVCTRAAIDDMLTAGWGRIVNVASTAGLAGASYISAYCASKHGVVGFTRAIAVELGAKGITANAVCPGYTESEMLSRTIANITNRTNSSEESARAALARSNPLGRIATADEVAEGVLQLIEGSQNGAVLVVPAPTGS